VSNETPEPPATAATLETSAVAAGAPRAAKAAARRTVLVTGSSRGIGRAIALRLARDGFDVVVHCRSKRAEADGVATEIAALGRASRVLQFDVVERELCAELLTKDVEAHGAYYGVVCNAGLAYDTAFPAMTGEQWDSIIRSNLDAFYNVLQPLIMPMVRRRAPGRIVTMSSVSGLVGNRGQVNYSAAKAGVIGATKALAIELAKRNITVARSDGRDPEDDSDAAKRYGRGSRRCRFVSHVRGCGVCHASGARGEWRALLT
jgi:3-oxoacyl-[acyl-carrier protein] reductase